MIPSGYYGSSVPRIGGCFFNEKTQNRYMHRPKIMRTICRRAGVRHFGFHALRHYVASYLADKKKFSITQISRLIRHQNKATTERYLQVVDTQLRDVMASLEEKSHTDSHTGGWLSRL